MKIKHVRKSEITFFEDYTQQKYVDLPEGSQTISSTMCLVLMRLYYKHRLASQKWWQKLLFFICIILMTSCAAQYHYPKSHIPRKDCKTYINKYR